MNILLSIAIALGAPSHRALTSSRLHDSSTTAKQALDARLANHAIEAGKLR